jgi:ribosomal-protein-alanine N-acetyltransferase
MSSAPFIRRVKIGDFDPIMEIEHASFGRDAYDRNLFADFARNCGGLFLVVLRGNTVIGYAIAAVRRGRAELISIAVRPKERGRGAAVVLMDSILRRVRRRGATRFALMVKVTNLRAQAFYEKYGFRKSRRVRAYYEDGADGFLFVKVL